MTTISNDTEFKKSLASLDYKQQREVAARFVENVLALSTDDRIKRVVKVARDSGASADELAAAHKSARAATFDSHTRCGSEGDWKEQAGYFVARAATAAVTPEGQCKTGGPAWQAAMSSRMARTSLEIDAEDVSTGDESEQQYRILADYMKNK